MDSMDSGENTTFINARRLPWILVGALVLFALIVFRSVLMPGQLFFSTDDGIGSLAIRKYAMPYAFLGWWDDTTLMGVSWNLYISWTNLWLWLLPLTLFVNWIHALDLVAASLFFALYLRNRNLTWPAVALAVLASFWIGSNFTLAYAGHIGKFGLLVFAAAYLWLSDLAVTRSSWALGALAGGALGIMFLEQVDVALFCALFFVPLTLVGLVLRQGRAWLSWLRVLAPLIVCASLIGFHPMWTGYSSNVKNVVSMNQEDPKAKWAFATQWSWPPEECIDFVAPGYMGWRSNEPKGPYWGRMGRSAGWESTHQGFMNFKLENQYIGIIPIALAIWICVRAWRGPIVGDRRKLVLAWMVITALALVLSFGKYIPLYALLYALPGFSSVRNPNKFLHVFQLGLAVLAACGLDEALRGPADGRRFRQVLMGVGCLFFLACLMTFSGAGAAVQKLTAAGSGAMAQTIVENKAFALGHAAVMAALLAVFLAFSGNLARRPLWLFLPALVIALDAAYLSRNYISAASARAMAENDVIKLIKSGGEGPRTVLAAQDGFYNYWLTYLFPYHNIHAFNVTQMPRMAEDYQTFLGTVGSNPLRLWEVAAVKTIVGPAQVWGQIQNDPNIKDQFELKYAFNVQSSPDGVLDIVPSSSERPGQHCVIEYKRASPRFALVGRWRKSTNAAMLEKLRGNSPMLDEVLVDADASIEPSPSDAAGGSAGTVTVRDFKPGRVTLGVSVERPAVLRFAERFTPDWKALVNGKPAPLFRCDYIMQGVEMSPGLQEVELRYVPPRWSLGIQLAGFLLVLAAIPVALAEHRRTATA